MFHQELQIYNNITEKVMMAIYLCKDDVISAGL